MNEKMAAAQHRLEENGVLLRTSLSVVDVLRKIRTEELLLPENRRTPDCCLVRCQYSLWLCFDALQGGGLKGLFYSDSLLIRGGMSLLLAPLCGLSGEEMRRLDWESVKRAWSANEGLFAGGVVLENLIRFMFKSLG